MKPLVLMTNRFDHQLKAYLPQIKDAEFQYHKDVYHKDVPLDRAQGLIARTGTVIDHSFLKKTPQLKWIVTATAGFDHIDLAATVDKGIQVFHTPEAQTLAAAELTLAHLFTTQRLWTKAQEQVRKGHWERSAILGHQLEGKPLG